MTDEMKQWVNRINNERQDLLNKKFLKGLRKKDRERLKFCNAVIELAYPSVSLADYKLLDDMEQRHIARKLESDKMIKDLGL